MLRTMGSLANSEPLFLISRTAKTRAMIADPNEIGEKYVPIKVF